MTRFILIKKDADFESLESSSFYIFLKQSTTAISWNEFCNSKNWNAVSSLRGESESIIAKTVTSASSGCNGICSYWRSSWFKSSLESNNTLSCYMF